MIYCKHCKKEIEPIFKHHNWKCPICNKFIAMSEKHQILESRPVKSIGVSKPIKLSGMDLHRAELLIEQGVAKDLNDLFKKSLNLVFDMSNKNIELNKDPISEDTMKKLKEEEMIKSYLDHLKNKGFYNQFKDIKLNKYPSPKETIKEIQKQIMMELYINHLKNSNSNNNEFDPLSAMMMMKMMNKNKDEGRITITIN